MAKDFCDIKHSPLDMTLHFFQMRKFRFIRSGHVAIEMVERVSVFIPDLYRNFTEPDVTPKLSSTLI